MLRLTVTTTLALCCSLPAQFFGERHRTVFETPMLGTIAGTFDADGDGDQDIFTTEGATGHIYANDGHARFTLLNSFSGNWSALITPAPSIGDLDGDGDLDFCIGTSVYFNQGGGSFLWSTPFPTTLSQDNHHLIDFDGDGDLDYLLYIFAFPSTSGVHLFENDGTGQFTDVTSTILAGLTTYAGYFDVLDVDNDGDSDVLLASDGFGSLIMQVWVNQGGTFSSTVLPSPNVVSAIANPHVGDINGDSFPDISVWTYFQPVWIALNDGTGVFTPVTPTGLADPNSIPYTAFADWNSDGLGDFVTQHGIYLQTQPLHFELQSFAYRSIEGPISIADLDGDQDPDAVATGSAVILNTVDGGIPAFSQPMLSSYLDQNNTPLDSRVSVGANPTTQILWKTLSEPKFFTDAVAAGNNPARHLYEVPLPVINVIDGAIVHNAPPHAATGVVITSGLGADYYELNGANFVSVAALPTIAGLSTVASANLDVVDGEEVVFGNAQHDGPRVFVRMASGFVEFSPSLPPAPAVTDGAFESIVLADMDGDGDIDIVHEHRVLYNEGGCAWTEGPSFSHLANNTTEQISTIDFDADGDRDLMLTGSTMWAILLENTGSGFTVVPASTFNGSTASSISQLSVADVDQDGLEDILAANHVFSSLLRNVGGTFVRESNVARYGVLIDADHDGRADIFNGRSVQKNLHTHLHAKHLALSGSTWKLDLETWRIGVTAHTAFFGIGVQEQFVNHPTIGRLYLDSLFADVVSAPIVSDSAQRTFAIPSSPALVGTIISAQALVVDNDRLQLSNPVRDRIR